MYLAVITDMSLSVWKCCMYLLGMLPFLLPVHFPSGLSPLVYVICALPLYLVRVRCSMCPSQLICALPMQDGPLLYRPFLSDLLPDRCYLPIPNVYIKRCL